MEPRSHGQTAYEIIRTLVVRDDCFSKIIITAVSLRILKKYARAKKKLPRFQAFKNLLIISGAIG